MKILAAAVVAVIALAWPNAGEAQSKKSKIGKAAHTQQKHVQRHAGARSHRGVASKPCVVRNWTGCLGWDPDPNVRSMIRMDAGHDDY